MLRLFTYLSVSWKNVMPHSLYNFFPFFKCIDPLSPYVYKSTREMYTQSRHELMGWPNTIYLYYSNIFYFFPFSPPSFLYFPISGIIFLRILISGVYSTYIGACGFTPFYSFSIFFFLLLGWWDLLSFCRFDHFLPSTHLNFFAIIHFICIAWRCLCHCSSAFGDYSLVRPTTRCLSSPWLICPFNQWYSIPVYHSFDFSYLRVLFLHQMYSFFSVF